MIVVNIKNDKEIVISGHALYDQFGKDIVCAAVSSIVTTTINGILSIDDQSMVYNYNNEELIIELKKTDLVIKKLIDNMLDMLNELSNQHPKNLKINDRR